MALSWDLSDIPPGQYKAQGNFMGRESAHESRHVRLDQMLLTPSAFS